MESHDGWNGLVSEWEMESQDGWDEFVRFLSNGRGVAGTAGKAFKCYQRSEIIAINWSTDDERYWSWFWAGPIRRVWRVIKEGLTQLRMQGFQKEVEGLKKEESSPNWGVQMASSAVLIIPSVFLVTGEYLFLLHTKLYHRSWYKMEAMNHSN